MKSYTQPHISREPKVEVAYFTEHPSLRDGWRTALLHNHQRTFLSERLWLFSGDGCYARRRAVGRLVMGFVQTHDELAMLRCAALDNISDIYRPAVTAWTLTVPSALSLPEEKAEAIADRVIQAANYDLLDLEANITLPLSRPM